MITQSDKRKANLSILQKLRQQGAPVREDKLDSMFDSLSYSEEGMGEDTGEGIEEDLEGNVEEAMGEKKESKRLKKKGPPLDDKKVDQFKKGFFSVP